MLSRRHLALTAFAALLAGCGGGGGTSGSVQSSGEASIGGPFTLVDTDGQTVTEDVLKGKWSAIYFGYTYCPDVCPTSLQALKEGLDKLGARGKQIQTILITVDPERDTPEVLKAYVDNPTFPDGLRGFTGTPDQIADVAKAYKVFYQKDGSGNDYLVQHQSVIYVMDPQGRLARPLTHDLSPAEIANQISDAMRQEG